MNLITEHSASGDGGTYACHRCDGELLLDEIVDHLTIAHPELAPTR